MPSHGSRPTSQLWLRPQFTNLALREISNSRACGRFWYEITRFVKNLANQSHLQQTIQEPNTTHLWSAQAASQLTLCPLATCWQGGGALLHQALTDQGLFSRAVRHGSDQACSCSKREPSLSGEGVGVRSYFGVPCLLFSPKIMNAPR